MTAHPSHPDQLMAKALGVCWHSPTADRWPCSATPPPSAAVPDPADVEKVARAMWRSDTEAEFPDADIDRLWPKVLSHFPADAAAYRRMAAAALNAVRPSPDSEAVARDADRQRLGVTCDCLGPPYYVCAHWPDRAALGTGDREGQ